MSAKELKIKLNDVSGEIEKVYIDNREANELDSPDHNVGGSIGIIWKGTCIYDPIRKKWYC